MKTLTDIIEELINKHTIALTERKGIKSFDEIVINIYEFKIELKKAVRERDAFVIGENSKMVQLPDFGANLTYRNIVQSTNGIKKEQRKRAEESL